MRERFRGNNYDDDAFDEDAFGITRRRFSEAAKVIQPANFEDRLILIF